MKNIKIGDWIKYTGDSKFWPNPIQVEYLDKGRVLTHYPDGAPYYMHEFIKIDNPNSPKQLNLF